MKSDLYKNCLLKFLTLTACVQLQQTWAKTEIDSSLAKVQHWNSPVIHKIESQLGRSLNDAEINLLASGERLTAEGQELAARSLPAVNFGTSMSVCAGVNIAAAGKYLGLVCYDWGAGQAITISGTDWLGVMAAGTLSVVILSGPDINDPISYRGNYVNPVGLGGAYILGGGGMKFQGKERVVLAEDKFTNQESPIDDSYSLVILNGYVGLGANLDIGKGSARVN